MDVYLELWLRKFDTNKPGTAKVGAISKAQKAQSFQNMPMTFVYEKLTKTFHPKEAFRCWKMSKHLNEALWGH